MVNTLTLADFARMIDHTYLKIDGGPAEVVRVCLEAEKYGFAAVAVFPTAVSLAVHILKGTDVKVCAALAFPLGIYPAEIKIAEALDAIAKGAEELDMVVNVGAVKAGNWSLVEDELVKFREATRGFIAKLILECFYLTTEEKKKLCALAKEVGLDFVKTSTGFIKGGGATVEDVKLMRETVGPHLGVKAAGGIRSLEQALSMIKAGATRLGTSSGVQLFKEFEALYGKEVKLE